MVFRSKYNYFRGNPDLNPQITTAVDITHGYRQHLYTTLTLSRTTHAITGIYQERPDKVLVITYENLSHYDMLGLNVSYVVAIRPWWSLVNALQGYYMKYQFQDIRLNHSTPGVYVNSTQTFKLPKQLSLELSGIYSSRLSSGLAEISSYWLVNVGLQKSILHNKGSLKGSINDIFRGQHYNISSMYEGVDVRQQYYSDSRFATLSFTYRFGNSKVKPKTEHQTGIEKEKKRIGGN